MLTLVVAFTSLTVFSQMLVVGLSLSSDGVIRLATDIRALSRAALSILIVVPAAGFALVALMPLNPDVATGLTILVASPGAPLTARRSRLAGADMEYVVAAQFIMALAAVVFTPVVIAGFRSFLDLPLNAVGALDVAFQISKVTLAPLVLGLALRRLAPRFAAIHSDKIALAADYMLAALAVIIGLAFVFAQQLREGVLVGWSGFIALALVAAVALVSGHLLGGPMQRRRAGLAIASVARNLGLALYVAELSPETMGALGAILAYALIGGALAMPYSRWAKKRSDFDDPKDEALFSAR